jgi:hypothetical protein
VGQALDKPIETIKGQVRTLSLIWPLPYAEITGQLGASQVFQRPTSPACRRPPNSQGKSGQLLACRCTGNRAAHAARIPILGASRVIASSVLP